MDGWMGITSRSVLCYFKHLRDLDQAPYIAMQRAVQEALNAVKKVEDAKKHLRRKKERAEEMAKVVHSWADRERFLALLARRAGV